MKKFLRGISFYILIIIIIYMFVLIIQNAEPVKEKLSYTQLVTEIESGRITEVTVSTSDGTSIVTGKIANTKRFEAIVPSDEFNERVQDYIDRDRLNVKYEIKTATAWLSILPSIVLIVIFVVFFFVLTQQSQGGGNRVMSFGKSRAKLHTEDKKKITFEDVAGAWGDS